MRSEGSTRNGKGLSCTYAAAFGCPSLPVAPSAEAEIGKKTREVLIMIESGSVPGTVFMTSFFTSSTENGTLPEGDK